MGLVNSNWLLANGWEPQNDGRWTHCKLSISHRDEKEAVKIQMQENNRHLLSLATKDSPHVNK